LPKHADGEHKTQKTNNPKYDGYIAALKFQQPNIEFQLTKRRICVANKPSSPATLANSSLITSSSFMNFNPKVSNQLLVWISLAMSYSQITITNVENFGNWLTSLASDK